MLARRTTTGGQDGRTDGGGVVETMTWTGRMDKTDAMGRHRAPPRGAIMQAPRARTHRAPARTPARAHSYLAWRAPHICRRSARVHRAAAPCAHLIFYLTPRPQNNARALHTRYDARVAARSATCLSKRLIAHLFMHAAHARLRAHAVLHFLIFRRTVLYGLLPRCGASPRA